MDHSELARLIESYRFTYSTEGELQARIEQLFTKLLISYRREARLNEKDRPDFMVGGIAVEVKVKSSWQSVLTQIHRYAQCDQVEAIVLVTNRARHLQMPGELNGKPVAVANLLKGVF